MKLIDVNILVYAVNRTAPQHAFISKWWEDAVSSDESIAIPWLVLLGFVRVSTNPRTLRTPLSVQDALKRTEEWSALPNVFVATETEHHGRLLKELLYAVGAAGNLVMDAHLAALAISHGATLYSCDNDFARFPKLRWKNPLNP